MNCPGFRKQSNLVPSNDWQSVDSRAKGSEKTVSLKLSPETGLLKTALKVFVEGKYCPATLSSPLSPENVIAAGSSAPPESIVPVGTTGILLIVLKMLSCCAPEIPRTMVMATTVTSATAPKSSRYSSEACPLSEC